MEREKEETISPDELVKPNIQKEANVGGKKKKDLKFANKNVSGTMQNPNMNFIQKQEETMGGKFSLKDLNPTQMQELNTLLEQYVEVPRA